jgi:hypothetical protein
MLVSKLPCGMPYMVPLCVVSHLEGPILNQTGSVLFLTLCVFTFTPPINLKQAAMDLEINGAEVWIEIVAFQEAPTF